MSNSELLDLCQDVHSTTKKPKPINLDLRFLYDGMKRLYSYYEPKENKDFLAGYKAAIDDLGEVLEVDEHGESECIIVERNTT